MASIYFVLKHSIMALVDRHSDPRAVMVAVQKEGLALSYASKELKQDKEVVMAARGWHD